MSADSLPWPAPARTLTWGLSDGGAEEIAVAADGAAALTPDWAWGGSTGRGVRVCVVDSGVEPDHPRVGPVTGSFVVTKEADGCQVRPSAGGDSCGHGTACAGIIREQAPDCELYSVQVLGNRFTGTGEILLAGLAWAIRQRFDVINLSLSTTRPQFSTELRELVDEAFFNRTAVVASAHNTPVESYPWRFASVLSVGSHRRPDPELFLYNPSPPVEFFAQGQDVEVAWLGGSTKRSSGNSFAAPRIAGLAARILAKHPQLTMFQLKSVLYRTADNVRIGTRGGP
jgi:subtilisin family serine protease